MARTRKASAAHREMLTDPSVQLRRELTVEVLEEPRHHVLACPSGLNGIAHGVDAGECRRHVCSEAADGQCAGVEGRKQALDSPDEGGWGANRSHGQLKNKGRGVREPPTPEASSSTSDF
jgi:hypothetical protein